MTTEVSLDELLPPLFGDMVNFFTGRPLLSVERDGLLSSIPRSMQWSCVRKLESSQQDMPTTQNRDIETKNGFSSDSLSRKDLISRMENSSGLPKGLCLFALNLIESELEIRILEDKDHDVYITEIGKISFLETQHNRSPELVAYKMFNVLQQVELVRSVQTGLLLDNSILEVSSLLRRKLLELLSYKSLRDRFNSLIYKRIQVPSSEVAEIVEPARSEAEDQFDYLQYRVRLSENLMPSKKEIAIKRMDDVK